MSSLTVSLTAFVIVYSGALAGMLLRVVLPKRHLSDESREVVKLGTGLVGTMAAMVLGLLVASAKNFYDAQTSELTQMSANIILLDRVLAHYGPETIEIRGILRNAVLRVDEQLRSDRMPANPETAPSSVGAEILYDKIEGLSPKNDLQRSIQSQALSIGMTLGQERWLMFEQESTSVSKPLLIVMVFWLTIIFMSWGLLASPNGTLLVTMIVAALSTSGAIFLILEMYTPFRGWIHLSDAPLRIALAHMGQ
jgi:hypothetical protein